MIDPDDPRLALATPTLQQLKQLLISLSGESERAAVIVGVSQLDDSLEMLLKSLFHERSDGKENLLETDRPLSTFSARISVAFRMGVIDASLEKVLVQFRKIRNDFAHMVEEVTLSRDPYRSRLNEILDALKSPPLYVELRNYMRQRSTSDALADFTAALLCTYMLLETAKINNGHISHRWVASFDKLSEVAARDKK